MTIVPHIQSGNLSSPVDVLRAAAASVRAVVRALLHRRSVTRLANLDARTLDDIGLTASDVRSALAEPLMADPSRYLADLTDTRRRNHPGSPTH